jgi:hypothetical protein
MIKWDGETGTVVSMKPVERACAYCQRPFLPSSPFQQNWCSIVCKNLLYFHGPSKTLWDHLKDPV